MKRILPLLLIAALVLSLAGCSKAAGGAYKLEYITADGLKIPPGGFGMHITFYLENDGIGTANYGGTVVDIAWKDLGGSVEVSGPEGTLTFKKDGKNLVLHDEGTLLFFTPVEEEEDD